MASAVVSILTSRHLLVELNVHYPLHLHFIQLATTALTAGALHLRRLSSAGPYSHQPTGSQWVLHILLAAVTATSLLFFT